VNKSFEKVYPKLQTGIVAIAMLIITNQHR